MVRHSDEFYDGMLQDAGGISCDFAYGLQDVIGFLDFRVTFEPMLDWC